MLGIFDDPPPKSWMHRRALDRWERQQNQESLCRIARREPPGALHCPKSLEAGLKAGVDSTGQAVRSASYFCNRENDSTCRRSAHVRNGVSVDSIQTRHQLPFLGPTLLPTLRRGFTAAL